mmetsp:Transcript_33142/g.48392  ORF Transcript_33142/g.48392 Transcript_33142/m.48392 type:complete len:80 (-) Transcript_33142:779-1018(-)
MDFLAYYLGDENNGHIILVKNKKTKMDSTPTQNAVYFCMIMSCKTRNRTRQNIFRCNKQALQGMMYSMHPRQEIMHHDH